MEKYRYKNLTNIKPYHIKPDAGILHSITINKKGSADSTITVYDANKATSSDDIIATIDGGTSITTFTYDVGFRFLTIVIAGTTSPDITVTFQ